MREIIKERLETDPTMQGLLTGGVWATDEISRQETPEAFDVNGEILPCALVALSSEAAAGPYVEAGALSARLHVALYFYQRRGYDVIDQAMARALVLLHREKLESGVWEVAWTDDVLDQKDDALGCSLGMSRYMVTRMK